MKEYMVKIWGGAWNQNANPSIEKDLGIKSGTYYFKTEEARNKFIQLLQDPKYKNQGIVYTTKHGEMLHKRIIFVGTLRYNNKDFIIHYDFGYEYDQESAEYMFTVGNYACDCNKSLFIRKEYGEDSIPELPCGDEIELIDYHFEYED